MICFVPMGFGATNLHFKAVSFFLTHPVYKSHLFFLFLLYCFQFLIYFLATFRSSNMQPVGICESNLSLMWKRHVKSTKRYNFVQIGQIPLTLFRHCCIVMDNGDRHHLAILCQHDFETKETALD